MGAMDDHNREAARLRAAQSPTAEEIRTALGAAAAGMGEHPEHGGWRQVGRCVYCGCGVRLYQGTLPRAGA